MNPIRKILIIVDPTAEEHPAVRKGALLAEKLGARLDLFCCDTKASRERRLANHMWTHPGEALPVSIRAFLEELAAPLRQRGLDVETDTECAEPLHAVLTDRTKRTTADLVIKDTHHHSALNRTFLTNTDWHLLRGCPVPLLLTKEAAWAATPKVVAAIDPGHVNDKPFTLDTYILDHAYHLSKKLGGELHVLHAYLPIAVAVAASTGVSAMPVISPEQLSAEERRSRELVERVVAEHRIDVTKIHVEVGGPTEVLPRIAGALHADIVTMGVIARSGLKRAFIGSTAEHVLERLPCDALVIKTPDFASLLPF